MGWFATVLLAAIILQASLYFGAKERRHAESEVHELPKSKPEQVNGLDLQLLKTLERKVRSSEPNTKQSADQNTTKIEFVPYSKYKRERRKMIKKENKAWRSYERKAKELVREFRKLKKECKKLSLGVKRSAQIELKNSNNTVSKSPPNKKDDKKRRAVRKRKTNKMKLMVKRGKQKVKELEMEKLKARIKALDAAVAEATDNCEPKERVKTRKSRRRRKSKRRNVGKDKKNYFLSMMARTIVHRDKMLHVDKMVAHATNAYKMRIKRLKKKYKIDDKRLKRALSIVKRRTYVSKDYEKEMKEMRKKRNIEEKGRKKGKEAREIINLRELIVELERQLQNAKAKCPVQRVNNKDAFSSKMTKSHNPIGNKTLEGRRLIKNETLHGVKNKEAFGSKMTKSHNPIINKTGESSRLIKNVTLHGVKNKDAFGSKMTKSHSPIINKMGESSRLIKNVTLHGVKNKEAFGSKMTKSHSPMINKTGKSSRPIKNVTFKEVHLPEAKELFQGKVAQSYNTSVHNRVKRSAQKAKYEAEKRKLSAEQTKAWFESQEKSKPLKAELKELKKKCKVQEIKAVQKGEVQRYHISKKKSKVRQKNNKRLKRSLSLAEILDKKRKLRTPHEETDTDKLKERIKDMNDAIVKARKSCRSKERIKRYARHRRRRKHRHKQERRGERKGRTNYSQKLKKLRKKHKKKIEEYKRLPFDYAMKINKLRRKCKITYTRFRRSASKTQEVENKNKNISETFPNMTETTGKETKEEKDKEATNVKETKRLQEVVKTLQKRLNKLIMSCTENKRMNSSQLK